MKKNLKLVLVMVLCISLLTSCKTASSTIKTNASSEESSTGIILVDIQIATMNAMLEGKLKGKGKAIFNAVLDTDISMTDLYIPCVIMMIETNNGTSNTCDALNNVGGLSVDGKKLSAYENIDEGIKDLVNRIKCNKDITEPLQRVEDCASRFVQMQRATTGDELKRYSTMVVSKYIELKKYEDIAYNRKD